MAVVDVFKTLRDYNKTLTLLEERHTRQMAANGAVDAELVALRKAIGDLTVRVAVLEEARNLIDDRVRRVMVEVIADWERQHTARETERLKAELTGLKQSRIVSS